MFGIDAEDCKIVELLMEDGRMQAAEIARRMGGVISERAIRYRIRRLVRNNIIQISAIPNPRKLGFNVIADVFIEVESTYIEEVGRRLAEHDRVSYVACSIGERDVSAQVVGRDNEEIYAFATEFIGKLPGVRKTTTSIVPFRMKDVYQWRIPSSVCFQNPEK